MNGTQFVRTVRIVMAFVVLAPTTALAQSAIAGAVRDTSGGVLPGVTVEASSPVLIEKTRTVVTDDQGVYRVVDLRPGVYTVTFTLTGFSMVRREGLELPDAFTATVNAEMRVGSLEETITVTGASPLVDVQNVTQRSVLPADVTDAIPLGGQRFVQNYVNYLPGVTGPRLSGIGVDQRKYQIHGGRSVDSTINLDGYNTGTSPNESNNGSYWINQALVQETTVQTAAGTAEMLSGGVFTNVIPKEGSNTFTGSVFTSFSNEGMSWSNLSDELKARGLRSVNQTKLVYTVEPAAGGRIVQDKLWFFTTVRANETDRWLAGRYFDTDPLDWVYTPDLSRQGHRNLVEHEYSLRLTSQLTPKNKVILFFSQNPYFDENTASEGSQSMESGRDHSYWPNAVYSTTWKSPVTSRLFFDAGAQFYSRPRQLKPPANVDWGGVDPYTIVPAFEESLNICFRVSGCRGSSYKMTANKILRSRAYASYITGSHAFKGGWQLDYGFPSKMDDERTYDYSISLRSGVPFRLDQLIKPHRAEHYSLRTALFVQDQWTRDRWTLNYGLRYDRQHGWVPAKELGAGPYVPARSYPKVDNVVLYNDLSPRFGIAYDLFGDGKTALKATVNRYILNQNVGGEMDPANLSVLTVNRNWTDADGDFFPDCDLANPLAQDLRSAGGDSCGQVTDLNFGKANPRNLGLHPDLLTGWGKMPYNWEVSAQLQRELGSGMSVNFAYFRRWFGNLKVTDNVLVTPADYDHFCVTAPVDARLPGGGGYQVCDLYDVTRAKFGQVQTLVNRNSEYDGEASEVWNGVDLTLNMRLLGGATLTGGVSSGRTHTVTCSVVDLPTVQYCDNLEPFQTQVKFLGSVPLPWGVQLSGVFQNIPGIPLTATAVYTRAQVLPSLGRNLNSNTVTVNLIEPNSVYLPRASTVDVRVAKNVRFGRYRLTPSIEMLNMLNGSELVAFNNRVNATYPTPSAIQQPRMVTVSAQLTF